MPVPEGYPIAYRLGLDMMAWIINVIISFAIAVIFFFKMIKSDLVNEKELNFSNFLLYTGIGFTHFFFQLGYSYPDYYEIFIPLGYVVMSLELTTFIYFWERNMIGLKKVPTLISFILMNVMIVNILYILIFQNPILEIISIVLPLGGLIAMLFIIILTFKFSHHVIGKLKVRGYFMILGILLFAFGYSLDTVYIYEVNPKFSPLVSPIIVGISSLLFYYGLTKIASGITSYYQQAHICIVHRGKILKNEAFYYCPSCNSLYCLKCYELVIKKEGCWNCHAFNEESKKAVRDKSTDGKQKKGGTPL
ncbi:MAG: hypothetical protein ACTSR8_19985 [Promethearchaeota archaeon]